MASDYIQLIPVSEVTPNLIELQAEHELAEIFEAVKAIDSDAFQLGQYIQLGSPIRNSIQIIREHAEKITQEGNKIKTTLGFQ